MIDPVKPDYESYPGSGMRGRTQYQPRTRGNPCLSIVTPFYNTSDIFHATACSIYCQTFQQWEWLIVNDGSTDSASIDMLKTYAARDNRIRLVNHAENRGLPAARNTGYRHAATSYVLQIDSDDVIEPTCLEKFLWFLHTHPEYGFVTSYEVDFGEGWFLNPRAFLYPAELLQENQTNPTVMVKKGVYEEVGGYDEELKNGLEDWEFWLHCYSKQFFGGTVPEYLKWYRRYISQLGGKKWRDWDQGKNQADATLRFIDRYRELYTNPLPEVVPSPIKRTVRVLPEFENKVEADRPAIVILVESLKSAAGEDTLSIVAAVQELGFLPVLCGMNSADLSLLSNVSERCPDIFLLQNIIPSQYNLSFVLYLVGSREPAAVAMFANSSAYEIAPSLLRSYPRVPLFDYSAEIGTPIDRLKIDLQDLKGVDD